MVISMLSTISVVPNCTYRDTDIMKGILFTLMMSPARMMCLYFVKISRKIVAFNYWTQCALDVVVFPCRVRLL